MDNLARCDVRDGFRRLPDQRQEMFHSVGWCSQNYQTDPIPHEILLVLDAAIGGHEDPDAVFLKAA